MDLAEKVPAIMAARRRIASLRPSKPTLLLCLLGVVLPNALAVGAELGSIGLPPRTVVIGLYALPLLFARSLHPVLLALFYVVVLTLDILGTISTAFYFTYGELLRSLHLGKELNVLGSPLYLALAAGAVVVLAANLLLLLRARPIYARGNRAALAGLALLLAALDLQANTSAHYEFGPLASWNQPFESAVDLSGFGELAKTPTPARNVMLVLVESLGILNDPTQQALLMAPFRDPELLKRYEVSMGRTTFFGATSYGEMRELCHTRDSYQKIIEGEDPVCLPDLFDQQGYRTVSVHAFTHSFYERDRWYPKVGFLRSIFHEDLKHPFGLKGRKCGGAFPSTCDVDLADVIDERFARATQPLFVYWLTLNTHVPVMPGDGTPRYGCRNGGGPFGDPEVCTMVQLWNDLFEAVNRIALAHAPMEILLVGDHAPPLWRRQARNMFEAGHVPWIRLTPKRIGAAPVIAAAAAVP